MMCGKQGYLTKKDAKKAAWCLKQLGLSGTGIKGTLIKRGRLKPYRCKKKECSARPWHLTSKK